MNSVHDSEKLHSTVGRLRRYSERGEKEEEAQREFLLLALSQLPPTFASRRLPFYFQRERTFTRNNGWEEEKEEVERGKFDLT